MSKIPTRASIYKPFIEWLDVKNIKSPVSIDSIERFEKQNDDITINVFGIEKELLDPEEKDLTSKSVKSLQEKKSTRCISNVQK